MRCYWKLATVIYIATMTGIAIGSIGHATTGAPTDWGTVFAVASFMVVPAVLAYMAGREDASAE